MAESVGRSMTRREVGRRLEKGSVATTKGLYVHTMGRPGGWQSDRAEMSSVTRPAPDVHLPDLSFLLDHAQVARQRMLPVGLCPSASSREHLRTMSWAETGAPRTHHSPHTLAAVTDANHGELYEWDR